VFSAAPLSRRTFLQATAAAFCIAKAGRAAVATGFSRLPYLQRLLADRVSILWTAAQPSAGSVVIVAPDGSRTPFSAAITAFQPATTQMTATYYQYQADITGLDAGANYKYQIMLDGQTVASDPIQNSFTTPATGDLSFLVFGDSGTDSAQELALVQRMTAETGIGKVIHVGDLAYDSGTFAQFETNYFATNAPLMSRLSFFATPGNHDYETDNAAAFLAGHAAPVGNVPAEDVGRYYSYDWGDVHFASVDSNLLPTDAATRMLTWLDNDLAASGKYWKIVFLHHTPYPTGFHLGDPICALVQANVNPIVERHGVQLMLTGHEHGYERSFPLVANQPVSARTPSTMYVVTGGGGGGLETVGSIPQCAISVQAFHYLRVDIADSALTFKAIGLDGTVIDMVTLNPPPVIAPDGGIVNAANFTPSIEAGSLVSIFGQNLAVRPVTSATFPVATSNQLGGISVWANDQPVPLLYVSPTQINLHMPRRISGQVSLRVTTPNGSASAFVTVIPANVQHLASAVW
jgi:acid phosphatase type 7